jgi:hypothetical protein
MLSIAGFNQFTAIFRYVIGNRHEILNLPGCRSKPDYDYNTLDVPNIQHGSENLKLKEKDKFGIAAALKHC